MPNFVVLRLDFYLFQTKDLANRREDLCEDLDLACEKRATNNRRQLKLMEREGS